VPRKKLRPSALQGANGRHDTSLIDAKQHKINRDLAPNWCFRVWKVSPEAGENNYGETTAELKGKSVISGEQSVISLRVDRVLSGEVFSQKPPIHHRKHRLHSILRDVKKISRRGRRQITFFPAFTKFLPYLRPSRPG
jgi:hypothetical protein